MGFEVDNADYAKEHGMNISPFYDQGAVLYFVNRTPIAFSLLALAVSIRSVWFVLMAIAVPLLTVRSQRFQFLWENAPWFKTVLGYVVFVQALLIPIVAIWPSPWIGLAGVFVALYSGSSYAREREQLVRDFNIPERGP